MSLCEIKLRQILNVHEFEEIDISQLKNSDYWTYKTCVKNITFFYKNTDKIVIGYKIKIYDNSEIILPVIGHRDIKLRQNLKKELIQYIKILENKTKLKKYLILIKYSNLPIEMINRIMFYYT